MVFTYTSESFRSCAAAILLRNSHWLSERRHPPRVEKRHTVKGLNISNTLRCVDPTTE